MTCDLEKALINAVRDAFPKATLVGRLFHWNQAIRHYMLDKVGLPKKEVSEAMRLGFLDILTVINPRDISGKSIAYVKSMVGSPLVRGWDKFWRYFERTWVSGTVS